jgi:hypothetical protein
VSKVALVFALRRGMIVYRNKSVYISRKEVELRLGTNIEVHAGYILLTYSQITLASTCRHPDACGGWKEPSP